MKKNYFIGFLFLFLSLPGLQSIAQQDTIRSLVITEFKITFIASAYVELTNMGDDTLNLSDFTGAVIKNNNTGLTWDGTFLRATRALGNRLPDVKLAPGKSWTMMNVRDVVFNGYPNHVVEYVPLCDHIMHIADAGYVNDYSVVKPEWEIWGFDSVGGTTNYLASFFQGNPSDGFALTYNWMGGTPDSTYADSVIVDCVNLAFNPANYNAFSSSFTDLAGIPAATQTQVFVRKSNIKKGNVFWELGKGTSFESSEWIPMPAYGTQSAFTTFGVHGDYGISMQSNKMDINMANKTIKIPWGNARRGDDIVGRMTIGKNMSWFYVQNGNYADSAKVTVCTGDSLSMYAAGIKREEIHFQITVEDAEKTMAKVFPLRSLNINNVWANPRYAITDDIPGMDTIFNITFAERVDTLYKYIEKAPKANLAIEFMDGKQRVDLKDGDILKVTAEDGATVKRYYLSVNDYVKSDNTSLSAITWPDIPEYIPGWNVDTIPGFSPVKLSYLITLPFGTTQVPALVAKPQSLNATVTQKRATSLSGGAEDRTTRFLVTSESDTLSTEYVVIFEVEKDPRKIQNYMGEPFFTELAMVVLSFKSGIQFVNPRNIPLDVSRYMIVQARAASGVNPALAIQNCITIAPAITNHNARYSGCYVPGYQFTKDTASWILAPGKLTIDPDVDPIIPPYGVFGLATNTTRPVYESDAGVTKWWYGGTDTQYYPQDLTVSANNNVAYLKRFAESMMLFKILNDSILDGTKQIGDPADFELVDLLGDATIDGIWPVAGQNVVTNSRLVMIRKPYVVKGSTEPGYGFGTTADSSDWIVQSTGDQSLTFNIFGGHPMVIPTIHLSTVASNLYKVSDGYAGVQTIQGNLNNTTVAQFMNNIIKADTGQVLTLISGASGNELQLGDAIAGTDTLKVVSQDKSNMTTYSLINSPLDDNATLTLIGTSSGLTINSEAETITGFTYGELLQDIVAYLKAPDLATMSIIDTDGNLVPLRQLNYDTVYVDTRVGANIIIEVVAQNGVNKKMYRLVPSSLSSDAYVISSIYTVNQTTRFISNIPYGVSKDVLFKNIEAVKGGKVSLLDKADFERTTGTVHFDDVVKVVSQDGTKSKFYKLTFLTETYPDTLHVKAVAQELNAKPMLSVYPVPARDVMTVKLEDQNVKQFTLSLISLTGSYVFKEKVTGYKRELDVKQFKTGTYIVSVISDGTTYNRLIIIK